MVETVLQLPGLGPKNQPAGSKLALQRLKAILDLKITFSVARSMLRSAHV